MDDQSSIQEDKVNKKLRATAKRILKQRKQKEADLANLRKIDDLLKSPDEDKSHAVVKTELVEEVKIPKHGPELALVDLAEVDSLFSENGLKLCKFVPKNQTIFGHSIASLSDELFKKLLLARIYELRSSGVCSEVSLYVFYLMACSANTALVLACTEFLHRFPSTITTCQVIPVLLNFGISGDALWGDEFEYQAPAHLTSANQGRIALPIYNIEKVMEYLGFCIEENLMNCDASVEPLLTALAKLPLDRHIGGTPLVACISRTLSLLAVRCSTSLGANVVADKILHGVEHPLNQLEIFRTAIRADGPLQRALLRRLIKNTTTTELNLRSSFRVQDLRTVIRTCKQTGDALRAFVALHLLINVVSTLKITTKDFDAISAELGTVENYAKMLCASDHMRLHSACAQLRGLVMMARDSCENSS